MKKKVEKVKVDKPKDVSLSLFDHLNNLSEKKIEFNPEDHKNYEPYMINRFVSMCDLFIPLVNEINRYDVPKELHYKYYLNSIPKRKQFFKYISKKKDEHKENRKNVMKYFQCGSKDVVEYLKILTEEQLEEINKKFEGGRV